MSLRDLRPCRLRTPRALAVCLIAGVLTVGCRTIRPENVEAFSTGVSGARAQTLLAFQGVTDLTSPAIIDYAASRPTLSDANFFVVLDPSPSQHGSRFSRRWRSTANIWRC
ncbi:MAG: hypothetical protein ABSH21_06790 [Verrucomicrobiia bacterium]|jgi:hypothetical protein